MVADVASGFLPVAPPRVVDDLFTEDQRQRMLAAARANGPWTLILSQYFQSPEEVIATSSGAIPEGFKPTWDMFMNPVFRGYFAEGGICLYPDLYDCFYNPKFLEMVCAYWGAQYAHPEQLLFNIQGPSSAGGAPHVDGAHFRGMYAADAPTWLLNIMAKSGLFTRWQAKKAQVIAWYYKGRIGGGFHYWPDGPRNNPKLLPAPMWGRGVVVENERMFHTAQGCGPVEMRKPAGLAIDSTMSADPASVGDWRIMTGDKVIQHVPESEFRFLVHWGAQVYMDYSELKTSLDHKDDIKAELAIDIFIKDLRARGERFDMPSDPLSDTAFIRLLTRVYDLGTPHNIPADPGEEALVA